MVLQTLGHYRILEKLGEGGWGIVYRAHDERLDRDVALKVLSAGTLADEDSRKRFRKEALTLAKLNHPNIEGIYDFDTQDGVDFLAVEYVSGGTLANRMAPGPLSEREVATLGAQIAGALEDAHEHGVIHRDLKPGNIAITPNGVPKVLDFGLAKLFDPSGGALKAVTLTESLAGLGVAGTLPYMAPEQVQGEHVDARTDIYALGVVLYEMATARKPFCDGSTGRLIDSILHQPPVAPRAQNPRVSQELERNILKCLEKEPEQRYQSAKELAVDLRKLQAPTAVSAPGPAAIAGPRHGKWLGPVAIAFAAVALAAGSLTFNLGGIRERLLSHGAPHIRSLAVLPLENLSHDQEQEYFADGMTDALITELAKIRALKVISRTSVMQYKGTRKPLPQIARELGVDAVVEGSVLREGDQTRITVQLIEGVTDQHLWANNFQRELRNILSLQGEVAVAIAREIQIAVTPEEQARMIRTSAVNPAAHELTLKATFLISQNNTNRESLDKGIELLKQAIQVDPGYAPAYAALSAAHLTVAGVGYMPMRTACPEFRALADKAIELDAALGDAYVSRSWTKFYCDWDWAGAEADARHALQLSPGSSSAHNTLAWVLTAFGRREEVLEHSRIAQQLDPLSIPTSVDRAMYFYHARRYEESVDECRKVLAFSPENLFSKFQLATTLTAMGKYDEAIQTFLSRKVPTAGTNWMLGYAYGRAGKREEARRVLNFLLEKRKKQFLWPAIIAVVYIGLDEKDPAFAWLETAYQEREYWLPVLKVDPMFDPIRSDPRFQDLVRRMNFPP